jgi:hypothetical protein
LNLLTISCASQAQFRIFHVLPAHTATIEGLTIRQGGVYNDHATLIIDHCAIQDSYEATGVGGGIYNKGSGGSATLTLLNSTVSNNYADPGCGGICNEAYQGGNATLTIVNSTVTHNSAAIHGLSGGVGGGICNDADLGSATLAMTNSIVTNNEIGAGIPAHGEGGGIFSDGTMAITNSVVSGNTAGYVGGGISNGGTLTIDSSTLSGNNAIGMTGGDGFGYAGGIANFGTLTITNSTLSGNSATFSGGGVTNSGTVTVKNSTLSGNTANVNGGIINGADGTVEIGNTILKAGASGANISRDGGTVTSHGYNLSSDNGGGFLTAAGDQINTDPMLGPLQNNGGPTFTHIPLTGSPAINAGDPNFTPPPLYDQRGYARVVNGRIDIGSLEVQPVPTPSPTPTATTTPSATATPTGTPSPTPTATPSASPTPSSTPARALNISTRLRVELGDRVMIGGFIITGNAPKQVAVRGIGPSLIGFGIGSALADPTLELRDGSGALLFQNDNWQDDTAQAAQLIALGLAPQSSNESAIVATLQPGASFTALLAGKNGGSGVGLMEIYDTDQAANSQLTHISTRGFVQTGDNVMIGGFILGGSGSNNGIVVRGVGPSLAQFGLSNVLADPTLELRDSNGMLLLANDNWQDDSVSAAQLTARGLAPQNSLESGIFASLPPGAFTAILAGKNSGTGIGLVEIYNVQ